MGVPACSKNTLPDLAGVKCSNTSQVQHFSCNNWIWFSIYCKDDWHLSTVYPTPDVLSS